jgi:type I restriction enzyme M protein
LRRWLRRRARSVSRAAGRSRRSPARANNSDELTARDKASLDITWLKDDSLEDAENLPPPEVIAQEIVEDLEAALVELIAVAGRLRPAQGADAA